MTLTGTGMAGNGLEVAFLGAASNVASVVEKEKGWVDGGVRRGCVVVVAEASTTSCS